MDDQLRRRRRRRRRLFVSRDTRCDGGAEEVEQGASSASVGRRATGQEPGPGCKPSALICRGGGESRGQRGLRRTLIHLRSQEQALVTFAQRHESSGFLPPSYVLLPLMHSLFFHHHFSLALSLPLSRSRFLSPSLAVAFSADLRSSLLDAASMPPLAGGSGDCIRRRHRIPFNSHLARIPE